MPLKTARERDADKRGGARILFDPHTSAFIRVPTCFAHWGSFCLVDVSAK